MQTLLLFFCPSIRKSNQTENGGTNHGKTKETKVRICRKTRPVPKASQTKYYQINLSILDNILLDNEMQLSGESSLK